MSRESKIKKFNKEDLIRAIKLAREASSVDGTVDLDIVLSYPGDKSDLRTLWTEEEIIDKVLNYK